MVTRIPLCTLLLLVLLGPAAATAQVETDFFFEDFDGVAPPALPDDWTSEVDDWVTDDGTPGSGSGGANLYHRGATPDAAATPTFDLSEATTATLSYLARRTGTYPADSLLVLASTDGGLTFSDTLLADGAALPPVDGAWDSIGVVLPPTLNVDDLVLRFEARGGTSGGANLRVDDVRVRGTASMLQVVPSTLDLVAGVGETAQATVQATNHTGAAVTVEAPLLEGAGFGVVPAGAVTLAPGAAQVYTVTFAPAAAGDVSGTLTLPYDGRTAIVALTGATARDELGFALAADSTLEGTDQVAVPLRLEHAAPEGLHGLQFAVTWSDPLVEAVGVARGPAVADAGAWTLAIEPAAGRLDVLLMSTGATGLPPDAYADLLTLLVDVGELDGQATVDVDLALGEVVGSLATPGGDDAGLEVSAGLYTLTVKPRQGTFALAPPSLDLGTVPVGATAAGEVVVTNVGGTAPLAVSGVASTDDLFTVTPADAVIAPDESRTFTVTFAPTPTAFGARAATVTFIHDGVADDGVDRLAVMALGTGGRGDADADGRVDVVDLVLGVDFVLGRLTPAPGQAPRVDLFPFPSGDAALDVRDLTVLVQALVRDRWPDDVTLPVPAAASSVSRSALAMARAAHQGGANRAVVHLRQAQGRVEVALEHEQPLRAAQIALEVGAVEAAPAVTFDGAAGTAVQVHADRETGIVRLVLYRPDGGLLPPGRYPLAAVPTARPVDDVVLGYAVAVSEARERVPVTVRRATGTAATDPAAVPAHFEVGAPFPQPFAPGRHAAVQVAVALPEAAAVRSAVFDVLGRRVVTLAERRHTAGRDLLTWDGRDSGGATAAPGLYLLRVEAAGRTLTRAVVVTH